jgi:hypothetical protein
MFDYSSLFARVRIALLHRGLRTNIEQHERSRTKHFGYQNRYRMIMLDPRNIPNGMAAIGLESAGRFGGPRPPDLVGL